MRQLFFIAGLLDKGRKRHIVLIWWFVTFPSQNEVRYSHNKCKDKNILIEKAFKLVKSRKAKKENN